MKLTDVFFPHLWQKCIAMCMDRYMDAWNTVSRTYNSRLQRERARMWRSAVGHPPPTTRQTSVLPNLRVTMPRLQVQNDLALSHSTRVWKNIRRMFWKCRSSKESFASGHVYEEKLNSQPLSFPSNVINCNSAQWHNSIIILYMHLINPEHWSHS